MEYCSARAKFASFFSAAPAETEPQLLTTIALLSRTDSNRFDPFAKCFI